jgi:plasmid maintenance system antidote protein VapI
MNWKLKKKIYEKFQSQSNFAHALNVHESNVSQVIRGRRDLDPDAQQKWAEVLGDNPQRLFQVEA